MRKAGYKGLEANGKAATRNSKVGSTPTGSTNRGLTHGFKARLNYHRSVQISKLDSYQPSSRHGVCGLVVKDLVKINDSKVNLPPLFYIRVAQLAEQRIHIPQVVGSIPTFDTICSLRLTRRPWRHEPSGSHQILRAGEVLNRVS